MFLSIPLTFLSFSVMLSQVTSLPVGFSHRKSSHAICLPVTPVSSPDRLLVLVGTLLIAGAGVTATVERYLLRGMYLSSKSFD